MLCDLLIWLSDRLLLLQSLTAHMSAIERVKAITKFLSLHLVVMNPKLKIFIGLEAGGSAGGLWLNTAG